jgi:hypothetical protein
MIQHRFVDHLFEGDAGLLILHPGNIGRLE